MGLHQLTHALKLMICYVKLDWCPFCGSRLKSTYPVSWTWVCSVNFVRTLQIPEVFSAQ